VEGISIFQSTKNASLLNSLPSPNNLIDQSSKRRFWKSLELWTRSLWNKLSLKCGRSILVDKQDTYHCNQMKDWSIQQIGWHLLSENTFLPQLKTFQNWRNVLPFHQQEIQKGISNQLWNSKKVFYTWCLTFDLLYWLWTYLTESNFEKKISNFKYYLLKDTKWWTFSKIVCTNAAKTEIFSINIQKSWVRKKLIQKVITWQPNHAEAKNKS